MIDKLEEKGEHGAYKYKINDQWEVIDAELTPPDQIDLNYCKEYKNDNAINNDTNGTGESRVPDGQGGDESTVSRVEEEPVEGREELSIHRGAMGTGVSTEEAGVSNEPVAGFKKKRTKATDPYGKWKF